MAKETDPTTPEPAPVVAPSEPVIEDYPAYLARTGATVGETPAPLVVEDYATYLARKGAE